MESSSSSTRRGDEDRFLDAPEDFFYDCSSAHDNSNRPSSSQAISPTSAANLRRRKSAPGWKLKTFDSNMGSFSSSDEFEKKFLVEKDDELSGESGEIEEGGGVTEPVNDQIDPNPAQGGDSGAIDPGGEHAETDGEKVEDLDVTDSVGDRVDPIPAGKSMSSEKTGESTVTTVSDDRVVDSAESAAVVSRVEPSSTDWSLFSFLLGLSTKAIEFQVSLMISLITFPPWLVYSFCIFVLDPFGTMRRSKRYITTRVAEIFDMILETVSPFLSPGLKDYRSMLKLVSKFGWGLFWAIYVGIVLVVLLVSALVLGGFVIRLLAQEPLVVQESLNFDYTKNSPEAYVPIVSCSGVACDKSCKENPEIGKIMGSRIIPRNHKIEITVSLTLPESEYNRNLGMFQVRVDSLSADGQTLASSRRPCMLKFRSEPIRLVQTLLKIAPLVTGYVSETQTLRLKFTGFVEKDIPTACLKVMIEQRAEFRPGAGVPELYDASMEFQSDLPFLKRIIWNWRKSLFVWISMSMFIMELLFTLICCRPLIIPRSRHRDRTPSINNTSNLNGESESR
ncbi:PREDICTED: seipin-2 [Tarenaya hassleriana]|uniref:seipin-2 n=1 Tax=Tarenaya hassleriana TaxID=28532 RepID=UPI00053C6265|nr:PREDICTED: seipin-2 [Tarenaya hassleriana]XP_010549460.1 PREDICTED: seipin-2 [Tarenaya hassleriana]